MRVIQFSDIHLWNLAPVWSDLLHPKRWLGGINLLVKRRHKFPRGLADRVISEILKQEADVLVFSGDITTQSHPAEFSRGAYLFAPLHAKWGDRFIVIPGNHDRYTTRSVKRKLYEQYFPYGTFPTDPVRVWELSPTWNAVAFDASVPFKVRSNGLFTEAMGLRLNEVLADQAEQGKQVLLVGHYPYAVPDGIHDPWQHKLIGKEQLELIVATHRPPLYVHGHKHIRWVLQPEATPNTVCINPGSAGMASPNPLRQAGFVIMEINDDTGGLTKLTTVLAPPDGSDAFDYQEVEIG